MLGRFGRLAEAAAPAPAGASALAAFTPAGAISTGDPSCCPAADVFTKMSTSLGGQTWPSADLAIFVPVEIPDDRTIIQLGLMSGNNSPAGNFDIGLYDEDGDRVVSTGSTLLTATLAAPQFVDVTDTPVVAGIYYLALAQDTTMAALANAVYRFNNPGGQVMRACGIRELASAFPLPASAADWTPRTAATGLTPDLVAVTA